MHIPQEPGRGFLQPAEQAVQALMTLGKARDKLSVNTERLMVGGDGSGAHLGLQAAWRMARQSPGSVDAVLALTPMVKPDFNTASYIRCASSLTFSRDDAVRSWHSLLGGRWQIDLGHAPGGTQVFRQGLGRPAAGQGPCTHIRRQDHCGIRHHRLDSALGLAHRT